MILDDKTAAPDASTQVEPPKIYLPACGVLCDIFWWARRDPSGAAQSSAPVSPNGKSETP
jgi:hypothetical protein